MCGAAPDNVDAAIATANGNVDTVGTILELGAATATDIGDLPPSSTLGTPAWDGSGEKRTYDRADLLSDSGFPEPWRLITTRPAAAHCFSVSLQRPDSVTGANFIESGDSGSLLVESATARPIGAAVCRRRHHAMANPIGDVIAVLNTRTAPDLA